MVWGGGGGGGIGGCLESVTGSKLIAANSNKGSERASVKPEGVRVERGEAVSVDFNCGSVNMEGMPVSQNLLRRIKGSTS